MLPNLEETYWSFTGFTEAFTEEILNWKLHFLCIVSQKVTVLKFSER